MRCGKQGNHRTHQADAFRIGVKIGADATGLRALERFANAGGLTGESSTVSELDFCAEKSSKTAYDTYSSRSQFPVGLLGRFERAPVCVAGKAATSLTDRGIRRIANFPTSMEIMWSQK